MTIEEQLLADDKMRVEIIKMQKSSTHMNLNTFLVPTAVSATLMGVTASIVKIFF